MTPPNKSLEEEAPIPNEFICEDASATDKLEVPDNTDEEDSLQTQEASTERTNITATGLNTDWDLVVLEGEPSDDSRYMMSGALPPPSDTSSAQPVVPKTLQPQMTVPTSSASVQDGITRSSGLSSSNQIYDHTKYRAEADAENRRSDGIPLAVLNDPSATVANVLPHALNLNQHPYRPSWDSKHFPVAGPSSEGQAKGKGKAPAANELCESSCHNTLLHCQSGNATI
jgi:hypothetical protein